MTTLTDRLNAIRERRDTAFRFPTSASKQAASATDVLPLLEAVEAVLGRLKEIDSWHVFETRDIGEAYLAESVQDLVSEIRQDLTEKLGAGR